MIKVSGIEIEKSTPGKRDVKVSLVADTKDEVTSIGNNGETVKGLKAGDTMTLGSTCLCASGDFGILNSDGVWTF